MPDAAIENLRTECWVSLSELARRRGITRQTAHERVAKLEARGLLVSHRKGREKLVDLNLFERVSSPSRPEAKLAEAEKMLCAIEAMTFDLRLTLEKIRFELSNGPSSPAEK